MKWPARTASNALSSGASRSSSRFQVEDDNAIMYLRPETPSPTDVEHQGGEQPAAVEDILREINRGG